MFLGRVLDSFPPFWPLSPSPFSVSFFFDNHVFNESNHTYRGDKVKVGADQKPSSGPSATSLDTPCACPTVTVRWAV